MYESDMFACLVDRHQSCAYREELLSVQEIVFINFCVADLDSQRVEQLKGAEWTTCAEDPGQNLPGSLTCLFALRKDPLHGGGVSQIVRIRAFG